MGGEAHWRGRAGLLLALLLWVASIAALLEALKANEAAGQLARVHGLLRMGERIDHLRGLAVMWALFLTSLQIASLLLAAGVLRIGYGLRSALCFALSGVSLVLFNALWIFGLLVWMRVSGSAG